MKIREFLTDKSKWGKGTYARDKVGKQVLPTEPDAYCFCLMWLIISNYPPDLSLPTIVQRFADKARVVALVEKKIGTGDIVAWNDAPERTFADVLHLVEALDI